MRRAESRERLVEERPVEDEEQRMRPATAPDELHSILKGGSEYSEQRNTWPRASGNTRRAVTFGATVQTRSATSAPPATSTEAPEIEALQMAIADARHALEEANGFREQAAPLQAQALAADERLGESEASRTARREDLKRWRRERLDSADPREDPSLNENDVAWILARRAIGAFAIVPAPGLSSRLERTLLAAESGESGEAPPEAAANAQGGFWRGLVACWAGLRACWVGLGAPRAGQRTREEAEAETPPRPLAQYRATVVELTAKLAEFAEAFPNAGPQSRFRDETRFLGAEPQRRKADWSASVEIPSENGGEKAEPNGEAAKERPRQGARSQRRHGRRGSYFVPADLWDPEK